MDLPVAIDVDSVIGKSMLSKDQSDRF
jgi:hypothetical protein